MPRSVPDSLSLYHEARVLIHQKGHRLVVLAPFYFLGTVVHIVVAVRFPSMHIYAMVMHLYLVTTTVCQLI